ncbi:MAG: hypothetical protein WA102_01315 [Candidatus Methanoperedens sp.]
MLQIRCSKSAFIRVYLRFVISIRIGCIGSYRREPPARICLDCAALSTPPGGFGQARIRLQADGVLIAGGWAAVLRSGKDNQPRRTQRAQRCKSSLCPLCALWFFNFDVRQLPGDISAPEI